MSGVQLLKNRVEAGRQLGARLTRYRFEEPVVLALLRGGVVVGYEVARVLRAPLDVVPAGKLSRPGYPEDAIGAVAPGVTYLNERRVRELGIGSRYIELTIAEETRVIELQERAFRQGRPPLDVHGRIVVLVDDGVATGATAAAALEYVRRNEPARVIFAAPICGPAAAAFLKDRADAVVCLMTPDDFSTVARCYEDFSPVPDAEVLELLERSRRPPEARG